MSSQIDTPMHEVGEEDRYVSDFYAYLDQPENQTRYTPTLDWIARELNGRPFSVLDVGCGHGQLRRVAPPDCAYVGIDHAAHAIERCRDLFPTDEFHCVDVHRAADIWGPDARRFDVVVLAGMINHMVDKDTLETRSDRAVVATCLERLAAPGGWISLIVGVPYRSDPAYGLYPQAAWKHGKLFEAVDGLPLRLEALALTAQVGLEDKIRRQRQRPDWFIDAPDRATPNRHTGEFIGALTAVFRTPSAAA
jgi:SAM-dependent methyltransferase